jgi:hypothetical protein
MTAIDGEVVLGDVAPAAPAGAGSRYRRLAESARGLRTRGGAADTARLLLIIGGILVPLGFVLIVLGWFGAAHTPRLYEQIPYAISGGLLGIALVFAGSFCYFTYWLTQLVVAARRDASETREALGRLERLLAASLAERAVAPSANGDGGRAPRKRPLTAGTAPFLATARGSMYHLPACPTVSDRDGLREIWSPDGLAPCRLCQPDEAVPRP